jgi:hypothetical protein
MYEEIRKPTLLKHIPMLLIRSLSTIYYFGKYSQKITPQRQIEIFESNIGFLSSIVFKIGEHLNQEIFQDISKKICELKNIPKKEIQKSLEKITIELSKACDKSYSDLKKVIKNLRMEFIELYSDSVEKINVLVIDNNHEPERVEKIASILINFCYYPTEKAPYPSQDYSQKLVNSDFAFLASTHPPQIHNLVKSLKTYKKPGLAIAYIEKNGDADAQAIRHGAQLQRGGFYVLYKVFTPIRLFTSIDKIFMQYHLQEKPVD